MAVPVPVLESFPLLSSLPIESLGLLAQEANERSIAKREIVLQKGSASQHMCFLVEGRLQGVDFTIDGREVGIYFVDPGDYFGELGVIDGREQPEFVVAVARSRVIFVPRQVMRSFLFNSALIAEQLASRLAKRLRESNTHRKILGLSNPVQRICAQLEQLTIKENGEEQKIILNVPTHQELAIMINLSRETVTRTFQVLQAKGLILRKGNNLIIIKPKIMHEVIEGKTDLSK